MNALRTVFNASAKTPRPLHFSSFLCLLALLAGLMPPGAQAAPRAAQGGLGQALALMASLHASQVRAASPSVAENSSIPQRTPNGRFLLGRNMLRPGALRANATGSSTVPIPGAVQTFDVNNPAPAFQPLVGFQNPDGSIGNNPANPPYFQRANALLPTNLTPVWSADETFLVFSSNRTEDGNIQSDGRFHLWAISVNGGEAYQITTSTTGSGEFFPTLSANDGKLAFISDAQSPGTENLYVLNQFSYSILVGLNNTQQFVNVSQSDPTQGGILSVTLRAPTGQTTPPTEAQSAALTGFDQVQRPVFAPNNDSELIFSAHSISGTNAGRYHLYFLFTTSGGFDPNNVSLPGKLTDGPADDIDASWSKDGQFIAFASTATRLDNQPNGQNSFGPNPPNINGSPVVQDPNQSQALTSGPAAGGLRSLFLLGGGTRGLGFGVVPASLQAAGGRLTTAGTDNFGPAWSFTNRNQFTNPTPGFEYLAFSRGASPNAPHDIYYLQAARIVDLVGQSQRSSEVATTPVPFFTALYQIDAGLLGPPAPAPLPYSYDEFFTGATAPPGGVENQAGPFDTSTDPTAPPAIYNTDRTDTTFSYDIPNLTPGVSYTVILHFLDPSSTAAGQRLFNLYINGQQRLANYDIYAQGGAPVAPSTLNRAVVVRGSVAVPYTTIFDRVRGDTIQPGHMFLRFTQTNPAKGNPIIQGIEVYSSTLSGTGTQATPSSGFGLLVATGTASAPSGIRAVGDVVNGNPQIMLTAGVPANSNNLGNPVAYNIFRSAGGQTFENTPNNSGGGAENALPYAPNVAPNAGGGLTFVDTNVQTGFEYFYQVTAVYQEQLTPEGSTEANGSTNTAVKLNTDDNAGQTSAGGNAFDDAYPAWSPGLSIFSITYSSNRTVTYNNPTSSFPTEAAVSVGQGGSVNTSDPNQPVYTIGAAYSGIFESQVLNLDPPTLLRFSPNEIIHVQSGTNANPVTGSPTKFQGLNPGRTVTFTVRMSDREAGIDNGVDINGNPRTPLNGGPAGAQVYLQIKNPNSKYQDAQALEHKVFAKDDAFNNQANRSTLNDFNSGTANSYLGLGFDAFEGIFNPTSGTINLPTQKWSYPPYGPIDQTAPITNHVTGRGAHGGHWPFPNGNNPDNTYIYVGRNGGGINPNGTFIGPTVSGSGGDPNRFIPSGPEYECQLVNPLFRSSGQPNGPGDTSPADFVDPFYLAGVDDQGAFSGVGTVRPTANGTKQDGTLAPAEWLQMTRVPVAQQDNLGGVLYTATLTTPLSASDFYLDVIAYDQAVFPNIPQGTSGYVGSRVNWRIYDNVGGFSTVQSLPNNDILVVSDYTLGQKFAATTFAGRNNNLNLVPKLFGTESYLTDVDVSILPDSIYAGFAIATVSPGPPPTIVPPFTFVPGLATGFIGGVQPLNGLGVGSFNDGVIDDGGRRDGRPDVVSQRYALWRILSRGPVPDAVLNSYLPSRVVQPAITDTLSPSPAYRNLPAGTVMDARRCVVWVSPYTGDLLTDPGALDDPGTPAQNGATVRPSTQTVLRNYVLGDGTAAHPGGGRLFITGQDIGSTLTLAGSVGNTAGGFLPDVLNATLASPGGGSRLLTSTGNRITGNPNYDGSAPPGAYPTMLGTVAGTYLVGGNPFRIPVGGGQYPYLDTLALGSQDYNDGALDQIASRQLVNGASVQGQIDTIAPTNGAVLGAAYDNGQGALVFHDDPLRTDSSATPGAPNGGAGSRVVYAAFGLEGLSTDYVSSDAPDPGAPNVIPPVLPHNARQQILHNIVCYLRTGSVSGVITQTAGTGQGAGQGVSGVTVYLQPASGNPPPTRAAFSATTAGDGRFTISGVEPGTYSLVAYKLGFTRATSNAGVLFTVEGDISRTGATLTIAPLPPGQIAGNIKDTSGNPIVGATATFTSQDKTVVKTATSRDGTQPNQPVGSYFVDNVPVTNYTAVADGPLNAQGRPQYTEAAAPDAPFNTGVVVQANTTTQPVNFTLAPILGSVSGQVFDTSVPVGNPARGTNVAGATVTLTSTGTGTPTVIKVTAAADGTYAFTTNVPPGTYTLTASKAGYAMGGAPVTLTITLGETFPNTNIGLTPLASISGRIFDSSVGDTDAGGINVAGATVTLTNAAGAVVATTSAAGARKAATDPAPGSYTFANVPSASTPTTYTVTATKVGFSTTGNTKLVTVVLGSVLTGQDIGLTPIPPGSITGRVTDATGAGVGGALVTFVSADTTTTLNATADGSGNYSLPTVFPGTYNGTATGPLNPNGRPTTTQGTATVTVASAPAVATANFSVVTIPPSLAGTVTDSVKKTPLQNALVTITDTASGTVIQTLHTDANGKYSTGPLPDSGRPLSQYTVTITASLVGFATRSLPSQSIYNGDALTGQDIALVSAPPGSVSGQVTDANNGAGVSGAVVSFLSTDGTTTLGPATTDANGNYSIPPSGKTNPSGNYIGSVTPPNNANGKPEFSPAPTQKVTIPANGTQTVNFTLTEILAAFSGTVLDNQTGAPVSGATVTLTDSTGRAVGTPQTTGATGTYSFANIPASQTPAAFAVSAAAGGGYFGNTITVTLSLGDSLTGQNIGLDEKGTITGLVTDGSTGQPLPNVALTVTDTTTKATPTNLTPSPLVTTPGTTIGPDGKTSNYTATFTLTPGHSYTVSASKPNYNPAAPVAVTPSPLTASQAGRADLQLTSGIGTLGGLVGDATTGTAIGGATVTVTSVGATGASSVVATFTTNSSVSPAPDGKTQGINYSGQVAQGSYTVTLSFGSRTPVVQKVTVVGGQFNRLDFTGANGAPPVFTFAAGLQFLSTPYDYSSLSFDTLFGILNTAPTGTPPNGNRTHVAVWDPTVSQYAIDPNAPADSLRLGVGYWVFLKNPVPLTVQGATPSAAFVPVALHPSWNQIGVPNIKGVPVSSLMFDNGAGGMISFATAASTQYHVVAPTLYSFDGSGYQPVTQSSVLQPWKAYWIQVYSGATLEIPTR